MILKEITLTNFKNISTAKLQFSPKINCFLGDNGMGKSNLLDAIHFLSFCKSFTGAADSLLISRGEDFAMLQAQYRRRDANEDLAVALRAGRAKSFKRSGKEYRRLSEHIGKFPLVLVSPADMDLVAAPEERRRFLDILISQTDARYLDALIRYNNALEQRNRLLRDQVSDTNLYLAIEMQMEASARLIADARRKNLYRLTAIFESYYAAISGGSEVPQLKYVSHLADPDVMLSDLFARRRVRDAALHYTSAGPHRDDIEMLLDMLPVRRAASQGQQKTFTIALRLAQYDFLHEASGLAPMLLLDDIFDKLDARRVSQIMQVVSRPSFGQIFITDTNRKHLDEVLSTATESDYALWAVDNGKFSPLYEKTEALSVGEIINKAIASTGNRDEYARQQALFLWPEVVGPTINRNTVRRWMDRDVMHVCLTSAVLKNELMYLTDSLRTKINQLLGENVVSKIIIH